MPFADIKARMERDLAAGIPRRNYRQDANRIRPPLPRAKKTPDCRHGGTDADIIEKVPTCLTGARHKRRCAKWQVVTRATTGGAYMSCEKCRREGLGYEPVDEPAPLLLALELKPHPNIAAATAFATTIPPYPEDRFRGRGIVVGGGGKYWPSVYVTVRMLRHVGCDLPVQVWHLGEPERDDRYAAILSRLGAEVVDSLAHPAATRCRSLTGFAGQPPFESKSFAVLESPFEEVLYLDADCYPCVDPTALFTEPRYRTTGGVFWPDLAATNNWTRWGQWGVAPFTPACGWEVGQYLIDKRTAWRQLQMARWYDDHGDWCYGWGSHHDHGDKGSWRVGWARFRTEPTFYSTTSVWQGCAFVHPGPDGTTPMFVHRCRSKFVLESTHFHSTPQNGMNLRTNLPGETAAFGFLDELRGLL